MKRFITTLLISALTFSLIGCENTSSPVSIASNNESGSSGSIGMESSPLTRAENETVTIQIVEWGNSPEENHTIEREGTYTGDMVDGVPEGYGIFTTKSSEGVTWTYTGDFKSGRFHGQGAAVWGNENSYEEAGTYTDGQYTPTVMELFNYLGPRSAAKFSIATKNQEFIQKNQDIFPATTEESKIKATALIDHDLTYPMLTKTLNNREGQLYNCDNARAVQVFEEFLFGHTVTMMIAIDADENYYFILHDGSLPDVYDDTPISFYGLPVSSSGFDDTTGGITNVIVILSSNVTTV